MPYSDIFEASYTHFPFNPPFFWSTLYVCRFIGGTQAEYGEFPSFVSLLRPGGGLSCLGSLVRDNWVVTTATCCHYGGWVARDPLFRLFISQS